MAASTTTTVTNTQAAGAAGAMVPASAPVSARVRAFFAPVARAVGTPEVPTAWDAAGIVTAAAAGGAPPAPWLDLGFCTDFARHSGTRAEPLWAGAPGMALGQARTTVDATVTLAFESWGKLQLALSAGVQQMNVLAVAPGAAANGSGGTAVAAVTLRATNGVLSPATSASALDVGAAAAVGFAVGSLVAVDVDYTGQTGFVGAGLSGGYIKPGAAIAAGTDYVRRVTLNVARVVSNSGGVLGLGSPLLAGLPVAGMQVSPVVAFCDREGGSFFQEWSALFVAPGAQGDAVAFHYPRLQAMAGPAEVKDALTAGGNALERLRLSGSFRALPSRDANDGEEIVCFRTYLPAAMRAV